MSRVYRSGVLQRELLAAEPVEFVILVMTVCAAMYCPLTHRRAGVTQCACQRKAQSDFAAVQGVLPDAESVEWVNMVIRKVWRVYQRGLETWIANLLQPVFDTYINDETPPKILKRIRIARFTLNHEPPVFDHMQRRNSRKESDINGIFNVRYCGGAKMLLILELGGRLNGVEIPVMVEDFDLDARTWVKLRLAPMCASHTLLVPPACTPLLAAEPGVVFGPADIFAQLSTRAAHPQLQTSEVSCIAFEIVAVADEVAQHLQVPLDRRGIVCLCRTATHPSAAQHVRHAASDAHTCAPAVLEKAADGRPAECDGAAAAARGEPASECHRAGRGGGRARHGNARGRKRCTAGAN